MTVGNWFQVGAVAAGFAIAFSIYDASKVGRYQFGPQYARLVWRIDTRTGDLSICYPVELEKLPRCTRWGVDAHPQKSSGPAQQSRRKMSEEELRLLGDILPDSQ